MKKVIGLIAALSALTSAAYGQLQLGQPVSKQAIMSNLASQPLCFTENHGQWGEKTLYKAEAGGATFYFCRDEVAYLFTRNTNELEESSIPEMPGMDDRFSQPRYKKEAMLIKAQFVGANLNGEVIGENRLSHNCNYFYGNEPSKWRTDVPNYTAITYKDIYPGIDLKYHGNGKGMKYDFIVNPGADISQIRVRYNGVEGLDVTPNGDLEAATRFGPVYERIPEVYQEIGGSKHEVSGRYVMQEPGVFGFAVEGHNSSLTLVIDPQLIYSTYLGGSGNDADFGAYFYGPGMAVDGSGNAYVTGRTESSNFPILNPYDESLNGLYDVFVTKLSATGNSLIYSTYLGGSGDDFGQGIAVDSFGNTYMTGGTSSSNFPVADPYDGSYNDSSDVFIAKLSADGNALLYSTYLGGSSRDYSYDIAIDGPGNAYVTGYTSSSNFPMVNPYDGSYNGGDAFVAKLAAAGNSLVYSTYLGPGWGHGIAIDASGNVYVTGGTDTSNFPTVNPYDGTFNGGYDVFVTKFSAAGNSLVYSTYLGGSRWEDGQGIAIDGSGSAYVTGHTNSANFPTVNPYEGSYHGYPPDYEPDVFVTKLSPAGNSLIYSTYLGGGWEDWGADITIDGSGNAYVTGSTASSTFPTVDAHGWTYNGNWDVFVAKFSTAGNSLLFSTFFGGGNWDFGFGIAVDGSGNNVYISGTTYSSSFPTTYRGYDTSFNGNFDVFLAKFSFAPPCTYMPGDINSDHTRGGGDVTYGVRFFKLIGSRPPDSCYMDSTGGYLYVAGDANGNCEFRGSDISRLVAYFKLIAPLQYCHFFPPSPMRENRELPPVILAK